MSPPSSSMAMKHRPCLLTLKKRSQAFETKSMRNLLRISYLVHKTDWVQSKINFLVGPQKPLLATVKRWKLAWFWHITCYDSLSKTIHLGTLEGRQCCARQRKCWMDNINDWTSLPMPKLLSKASGRRKKKLVSPPEQYWDIRWMMAFMIITPSPTHTSSLSLNDPNTPLHDAIYPKSICESETPHYTNTIYPKHL